MVKIKFIRECHYGNYCQFIKLSQDQHPIFSFIFSSHGQAQILSSAIPALFYSHSINLRISLPYFFKSSIRNYYIYSTMYNKQGSNDPPSSKTTPATQNLPQKRPPNYDDPEYKVQVIEKILACMVQQKNFNKASKQIDKLKPGSFLRKQFAEICKLVGQAIKQDQSKGSSTTNNIQNLKKEETTFHGYPQNNQTKQTAASFENKLKTLQAEHKIAMEKKKKQHEVQAQKLQKQLDQRNANATAMQKEIGGFKQHLASHAKNFKQQQMNFQHQKKSLNKTLKSTQKDLQNLKMSLIQSKKQLQQVTQQLAFLKKSTQGNQQKYNRTIKARQASIAECEKELKTLQQGCAKYKKKIGQLEGRDKQLLQKLAKEKQKNQNIDQDNIKLNNQLQTKEFELQKLRKQLESTRKQMAKEKDRYALQNQAIRQENTDICEQIKFLCQNALNKQSSQQTFSYQAHEQLQEQNQMLEDIKQEPEQGIHYQRQEVERKQKEQRLSAEITQLQQQIKEHTNKNNRLDVQNLSLKLNISAAKPSSGPDPHQLLQKEQKDEIRQKDELINHLQAAEGKIKTLQKQLAQNNMKLLNLNHQLQSKQVLVQKYYQQLEDLKTCISQKDSSFSQLVSALESKVRQLQQSNSNLDNLVKKMKQQATLYKQIAQQESDRQAEKQSILELQSHVQYLKLVNEDTIKKLQSTSQENQDLKKQLERIKIDIQRAAKEAEENDSAKQMGKRIQQSHGKIQQLEQLLKMSKSSEEQLMENTSFLNKQIAQLQDTLKNKVQQAESLHQEVARLTEINQQHRSGFSQLEQTLSKLSTSLDSLRAQFEIMNQAKLELEQRNGELQRKISSLSEDNSQLQKERQDLQFRWSQCHERSEKEKESFQKQVFQAKMAIEELQAEAKKPKQNLGVQLQSLDLSAHFLFQNRVLENEPQHKTFIKQSIQKSLGRKILRTKLVYAMDPLNTLNIHKYIDKKQNLIVVIRLINGYYLAAFTEDYFQAKKASTKAGLILALTIKEVFTLLEANKRAISYDDFFIIFGNSEVRLKTGEKKMFSNFGINNGYFNTRGIPVSALLGGAKQQREVMMDDFEFYQIEFK